MARTWIQWFSDNKFTFLRGVSEGRFSIVPAVADLNKKGILYTLYLVVL